MTRTQNILALFAFAVLAACNGSGTDTSDGDQMQVDGDATATPEEPVSIIRPDVEQPEMPDEPLQSLETSIGFPDGGSDLSETATSALEQILGSDQITQGGAITLRAHSDAGGSDAANLRASQQRGEAVRDWLVSKGVDEGRITVIAFGEQNPVEPNALPDGSPNESGREANRRVDVEVSVMSPAAPPIMDEAETAD